MVVVSKTYFGPARVQVSLRCELQPKRGRFVIRIGAYELWRDDSWDRANEVYLGVLAVLTAMWPRSQKT